MATGWEAGFYRDIGEIKRSLQNIEQLLEQANNNDLLATAVVHLMGQGMSHGAILSELRKALQIAEAARER